MRKFSLWVLQVILVLVMPAEVFAGSPKFDMPIGYSVNIQMISKEKLQYAKSLGIDYIELSNVGSLLDKQLNIKYDAAFWEIKIDSIKRILDEVGIKVWSIHMPFSEAIDLSVLNEESRAAVVNAHLQLFHILKTLKPSIILFHPSYYLGKNERDGRIKQLVKSVSALNREISEVNHTQMVVENMLGPELLIGHRERPLLRTVEECETVFDLFPKSVGLAVDMCHIMHAELLIERFGSRVKTVHVSDGDGKSEAHYLPCNGLGNNDWNLIFGALDQINYKGVFMYECKYSDERELKECYDQLEKDYNNYKSNNKRI